MDDGIRISNDKRHRSSSSLTGGLDGTRSERKLDIRASIPETDDNFAIAEARCENLQEKIDLVKTLKKRRKLKKRSMTTIAEPQASPEAVPFITVRAQPKKKVSQQAARIRRLEPRTNQRGYLDPDLIEQHHMLGRVHAYRHMHDEQKARHCTQEIVETTPSAPRNRGRRARADGDAVCGQGVQIDMRSPPQEVACGDDESDTDEDRRNADIYEKRPVRRSAKNGIDVRVSSKSSTGNRRRHVPKEQLPMQAAKWSEEPREQWRASPDRAGRRCSATHKHENIGTSEVEIRPVVELFTKNRRSPELWQSQQNNNNIAEDRRNKKVHDQRLDEDVTDTGPLEDIAIKPKKPKTGRRVKYHSRRYELPTVSSQMKQAGMRYYYGNTNQTNIPFIVSKSTAPSHNVGVNLQQVLNGVKMQQPLSGIPLTIAHHMGLRHVPTFGTKSATMQPMLHKSEINVIKLGQRMLHLPSYKYMSYNRLLALYSEGDGIVPRFLRAISRPHYFYTSMYNLTTTNREDFDAATSKGRGGSQDAKQSLAEFANMYREYEQIEKCLNENYDPELEIRKEELARQLASREEYIQKVFQKYKSGTDTERASLRASTSNAEEGYRHSTFKLNSDEPN